MKRIPVDSTSIKSVGHDPASDILHVEFHSGLVYEYPGVDAGEHQRLIDAPSIGSHFGKHIRPHYHGEPL